MAMVFAYAKRDGSTGLPEVVHDEALYHGQEYVSPAVRGQWKPLDGTSEWWSSACLLGCCYLLQLGKNLHRVLLRTTHL